MGYYTHVRGIFTDGVVYAGCRGGEQAAFEMAIVF